MLWKAWPAQCNQLWQYIDKTIINVNRCVNIDNVSRSQKVGYFLKIQYSLLLWKAFYGALHEIKKCPRVACSALETLRNFQKPEPGTALQKERVGPGLDQPTSSSTARSPTMLISMWLFTLSSAWARGSLIRAKENLCLGRGSGIRVSSLEPIILLMGRNCLLVCWHQIEQIVRCLSHAFHLAGMLNLCIYINKSEDQFIERDGANMAGTAKKAIGV